MPEKVRVDKWLWTVRIFKSRTKATECCKKGNVKIDEKSLKPSYLVTVGETLHVRKNGYELVFKVNALLKSRVSATLAEPCYEDLTPADEINKYKSWYIGKFGVERREKGAGRPTKRERREIDEYKDDMYNVD